MRIYQVYDSSDPAGSDSFHPSLGSVLNHLMNTYGFRPKIVFTNDIWEREVGDSMTVYVWRHNIGSSATAVCEAITTLPNR